MGSGGRNPAEASGVIRTGLKTALVVAFAVMLRALVASSSSPAYWVTAVVGIVLTVTVLLRARHGPRIHRALPVVALSLIAVSAVLGLAVRPLLAAPVVALAVVAAGYDRERWQQISLQGLATVVLGVLVVLDVHDEPSDLILQVGFLLVIGYLGTALSAELRQSLAAQERALAEAEQRASMLEALARMRTLDHEEAGRLIVDAIIDLGFDMATLAAVEDGMLVPLASRGFPSARQPYPISVDVGLAGIAAREGRLITVTNYQDLPGALQDRDDIGLAVAVPVMVEGRVAGILIGASTQPGVLTDDQQEVMEVVAAHAGQVLGNVRRFEAERGMVERLTALDRMKNEFVSNVSHELRTPLTVVRGLSETLVSRPGLVRSDTGTDLLARLNENAERLHTMIGSLLDFSRFDTGRVADNRERVELGRLIRHVVRRLEPAYPGHRMNLALADRVEALVDPELFEHVIENLLTNAGKHTPPGTQVMVSLEIEGDTVTVAVADDGQGVTASELPRLTDRYFRGADGAGGGNGVGLGLALVKQILAGHDSRLQARSGDGEGTRFWFTLPLAPVDVVPPAESAR